MDNRANTRRFFDTLAPSYAPIHGSASELVDKHMRILRRYGNFALHHTVVDLGCGPGYHLVRLVSEIGRGVGIDLSSVMVDTARQNAAALPCALSCRREGSSPRRKVRRHSEQRRLCVAHPRGSRSRQGDSTSSRGPLSSPTRREAVCGRGWSLDHDDRLLAFCTFGGHESCRSADHEGAVHCRPGTCKTQALGRAHVLCGQMNADLIVRR